MDSRRYTSVRKMAIAAMFMALATLLTAFAKMIKIPGITFVTFSFGPAIIMFISLSLGPLYGALVGVGSDALAAVLFSRGIYNPIYTVIAGLWGVLPWAFSLLSKKFLRRSLRAPWPTYVLQLLILGLTVYAFYGTSIFDKGFAKVGPFLKPTILGCLAGLDLLAGVGLYFMNRHFQKNEEEVGDIPSPSEVSFLSCLLETLLSSFGEAGALYFYFHVLVDSKTFSGVSYGYFFLALLLMSTVNIVLDSFLVSWLLLFAKKYGGNRGSSLEN